MIEEQKLKVFVYGTLKVGGGFAHRFDKFRVSTKPGKITGTMFNIFNSYPGVVLKGDTIIKGEVHEYVNAAAVEKALDMIEGFRGEGHTGNLYNKSKVVVNTNDGEEECFMYEYARNTSDIKKVEEGEWQI
ncbi:gamma-glutamylcyclotransferase [bacterium]|nr:gamma-glutamylcyclotransferase [bacterium]